MNIRTLGHEDVSNDFEFQFPFLIDARLELFVIVI